MLAEDIPLVVANLPTAELVKVAANAFLATKISFINAMAELCDATGGDVTRLAEAIGHDDRIGGKFLQAGIGFGGGCLPKDLRAFMAPSNRTPTTCATPPPSTSHPGCGPAAPTCGSWTRQPVPSCAVANPKCGSVTPSKKP